MIIFFHMEIKILKFYILVKGILYIMNIKDHVVYIYQQIRLKNLYENLKHLLQVNLLEKYLLSLIQIESTQ